ncbi:uncharacterized protein KY384_005055 [Bacidia gigantensis]|uniref:uncharacterized protein n=1 Tax=Bacidia gigantensis TaxID=2732470 RepID=UPI001D03CBEE|nr:uncharacterized protein KY384_005055 [Bacidia gigantensis]KAG8530552.1 hypothetical protein KY384_005055 [Bacidia gigantensis]
MSAGLVKFLSRYSWFNGGPKPNDTCPYCRAKVYLVNPRQLDQDIEKAVLEREVNGDFIDFTVSTQGIRDALANTLEALLYHKVAKLPKDLFNMDQHKLSNSQIMDCVLQAIGVYLIKACTKGYEPNNQYYHHLLSSLCNYATQKVPKILEIYRIELEEAIRVAIVSANWLKFPYWKKLALAREIILSGYYVGTDSPPGWAPSSTVTEEMLEAARAAPRLILNNFLAGSQYHSKLWRPDVSELLKADIDSQGKDDPMSVYSDLAHPRYRTALVAKVLEHWGITDVNAKKDLSKIVRQNGTWVIEGLQIE